MLGDGEWSESRPRPGGAPKADERGDAPASSPTERGASHPFAGALPSRGSGSLPFAHGGVWTGVLRLSDPPDPLAEGNSSRDTVSASDDGSGASDGAPEGGFDENTSDVSGAPNLNPHHAGLPTPAASDSGAPGGDGGSVVGDEEPDTSVDADTPPPIRRLPSISNSTRFDAEASDDDGVDDESAVARRRVRLRSPGRSPPETCAAAHVSPPGDATGSGERRSLRPDRSNVSRDSGEKAASLDGAGGPSGSNATGGGEPGARRSNARGGANERRRRDRDGGTASRRSLERRSGR